MIYQSQRPLQYPRDATITDVLLKYNLTNSALDKPSIIDAPTGKVVYTYASFRVAVQRVAHHLQQQLHLQQGEVVGILSTNKLYFPVVVHGILAAGGVVSALNPLYRPEELAHALQLSRPKHVFCQNALLGNLIQSIRHARTLVEEPHLHVWDAESLVPNAATKFDIKTILESGATTFRPMKLSPEQIATQLAFICFSSGTSGLVKGVKLSHGNVVANVYQQAAALDGMFAPKTVFALAVPMFHILGLAGFCCQYIMNGAPIVLFQSFDFPLLLKAIQRDRITHMNVVPPIALEFLRNPAVSKADFSSVQAMMNAAAPLKHSIAEMIAKKLDCVVTQWYGMTEASPSVISQREDEAHIAGTVGRLLPGIELRVVREDGSDAPRGESGEFFIRGPNLMQGYVEYGSTSQSTSGAFTSDAFFKTGDIGYIDENGYCFLVDRAKEMIKVKGNQVAPAELEAVLLSHPLVTDAAVCGVQDLDGTTEIPIAYIPPPRISEASADVVTDTEQLARFCMEVERWVEGKVASYKRLKGGVHILPNGVPRNPSGKILRRLLPANLERARQLEMEHEKLRNTRSNARMSARL